MRQGEVIGVFQIGAPEPGALNSRQIELVGAFADQAVIAIENARLFEEVQARTRELTASLEDLRKAQDRLIQSEKLASLGQLTAGIAHEIKNPLNFVNNFSSLSSELIDELRDTLQSAPFEPTRQASTRNVGGKVEIRIRDNGVGIPDEVKAKMFNPFFTTKPAGEGTGLGLSLSHDIVVKQHGGEITVATKPGEFTEFT